MERGKRFGRCGERRTRANSGVVKYLHSVGLLDWFRNLTRLLLPLATCGINQVNEYLILFVDSRNTSDNLASAVMLLCAPHYKAGVYKGVAFSVVRYNRVLRESTSLRITGRVAFIPQSLDIRLAALLGN